MGLIPSDSISTPSAMLAFRNDIGIDKWLAMIDPLGMENAAADEFLERKNLGNDMTEFLYSSN